MDDKGKKVLDYLQGICSKREYCRSDVLRKAIDRLDGDRSGAEELVDSLVKDRFVDDFRYACAYAREKSFVSGWGPHKVSTMLLSKQIDRQTIQDALSDIDAERASAKLSKVLEVKWKSLAGDPQAKYKLLRFALSRGYDYSQVRPLVDAMCGAE